MKFTVRHSLHHGCAQARPPPLLGCNNSLHKTICAELRGNSKLPWQHHISFPHQPVRKVLLGHYCVPAVLKPVASFASAAGKSFLRAPAVAAATSHHSSRLHFPIQQPNISSFAILNKPYRILTSYLVTSDAFSRNLPVNRKEIGLIRCRMMAYCIIGGFSTSHVFW